MFLLIWIFTIILIHDPVIVKFEKTEKKNVLKVLFDSSESTLLRGDTPWNLAYKNKGELIRTFANDTEVEYYTFDEALHPMNVADIFVPEGGKGTNLPLALQDFYKDSTHTNIQCLVFTDGQTPWQNENWNDLIHSGIKIHAVGLGKKHVSDTLDLKINYLSVPKYARIGDSVRVSYQIEKEGFIDKPVLMKVFAGSQQIQNKMLYFGQSRGLNEDSFTYRPENEGPVDMIMELEVLENEIDKTNNRVKRRMQVSAVSPKILWIQEELNFDHATLLKWVRKTQPMEMDYILKVTRGNWKISTNELKQGMINKKYLGKYQSIWILGDPMAYFSAEDWSFLVEYISSTGGNILFYPNRTFFEKISEFPVPLRTCIPIIDKGDKVILKNDVIFLNKEKYGMELRFNKVYSPIEPKPNVEHMLIGTGKDHQLYDILLQMKLGKGYTRMICARGIFENILNNSDNANVLKFMGHLGLSDGNHTGLGPDNKKEWVLGEGVFPIHKKNEIAWKGQLTNGPPEELVLKIFRSKALYQEYILPVETIENDVFQVKTSIAFDVEGKYELKLFHENNEIDENEISVVDHQMETSYLELNELFLRELSSRTGGVFYDELSFIEQNQPIQWHISYTESFEEIKLRENVWVMLSLILLLCLAFFLKRSVRIP